MVPTDQLACTGILLPRSRVADRGAIRQVLALEIRVRNFRSKTANDGPSRLLPLPDPAGECFRAKKDVVMTGKYSPPAVTIRSYPDSPICDVVVVVRGQEMVLRCRDYRQAMQWARLERKTYKIPEPDTGFPADEESGDLPLFLRSDRN